MGLAITLLEPCWLRVPPELLTMRILTAEDDFASRILLDAVLTKWGYEVVAANDGEAAWQSLSAENAPPIAILDWMMPGLSGVEVCARVRKDPRELAPYILMLTTKGQKADISFGLDAGADDYLTKPFDLVELGARLRVAKRSIAMQRDLIAARKAVEYGAAHDLSTGALNRSAIIASLSNAIVAGGSLTIALVALDGHRALQEQHGAECAEAAMRDLVQCVRSEAATVGIGRYTPDELLLVLPGETLASSLPIAERVRSAIASSPFASSTGLAAPCTTSVGLAAWDGVASTELLLCYADAALYAARGTGDAIDVFSLASETAAKAG